MFNKFFHIKRSKENKALFSQAFILMLCVLFSLTCLSSCGKGQKKVPGLENFHVSVLSGRLYTSFLSTSLNWDTGITMPVPGIDDSEFSFSPNLEGEGTIFQFSVGIASLLHNGKQLPVAGLPDGRALPDIRGGGLPRWDVPVKNILLSIYLSDDAFGLFIPIVFKNKSGVTLPWMVSTRIEDERGNLLGKAYALPPNINGTGSGLLILLPYLGGAPQNGSSITYAPFEGGSKC